LPEAVVYRKGIYGHRQMLRVNLRKTFSAGIISEMKEQNSNQQHVTSRDLK